MACGVDTVEVDPLDGLGARGLHLRDGFVAFRVVRKVGQHDACCRIAQVALADRQPDLRRSAEQQNGLGIARRVEHHLQKLQTSGHVRGEYSVGIDLAAHRNPLVDARIHGMEHLGRRA